jgi:hypothetical protein
MRATDVSIAIAQLRIRRDEILRENREGGCNLTMERHNDNVRTYWALDRVSKALEVLGGLE